MFTRSNHRSARFALRLAAAVVAALLFASSAAQATPIVLTLADLLAPEASIVSGDKVFTDFTYLRTGDMPDASAVNVAPVQLAGNYGLLFQGAFADLPGGCASDAVITYTVSIAEPFVGDWVITDAHIDASISAPTGGFADITDTFFPMNALHITATASDLSDAVFFPTGYTTLNVQKDILLYASPDGGPVVSSLIYQTYSQTTVPEPSTLVLLGTGAVGLLGVLRRRSMK